MLRRGLDIPSWAYRIAKGLLRGRNKTEDFIVATDWSICQLRLSLFFYFSSSFSSYLRLDLPWIRVLGLFLMVNWTGRAADPTSSSLRFSLSRLISGQSIDQLWRKNEIRSNGRVSYDATLPAFSFVFCGEKEISLPDKSQSYFIIQNGTLSSAIIEIDFLSIYRLLWKQIMRLIRR